MKELNIRNKSQSKTWMRWYRSGETHLLEQPVGKQYSYGKGPKYGAEMEKAEGRKKTLSQA